MRDDEGYARFFAYMNLFVASMIMLVLANNLLLLVPGMGRRRAVQLPADRILVSRAAECACCAQSLHRDPRSAIPPLPWDCSSVYAAGNTGYSGTDASSFGAVDPGQRHCDSCGGAVAGRSSRQVRAIAASDLVAGRDGRPDADQCADSCRDHGHGGRLPDCAHARAVYAGSFCSTCRWPSSAPPRCCWLPSARLPSAISSAFWHTPPSVRSATCSSRLGWAHGQRPCSIS